MIRYQYLSNKFAWVKFAFTVHFSWERKIHKTLIVAFYFLKSRADRLITYFEKIERNFYYKKHVIQATQHSYWRMVLCQLLEIVLSFLFYHALVLFDVMPTLTNRNWCISLHEEAKDGTGNRWTCTKYFTVLIQTKCIPILFLALTSETHTPFQTSHSLYVLVFYYLKVQNKPKHTFYRKTSQHYIPYLREQRQNLKPYFGQKITKNVYPLGNPDFLNKELNNTCLLPVP